MKMFSERKQRIVFQPQTTLLFYITSAIVSNKQLTSFQGEFFCIAEGRCEGRQTRGDGCGCESVVEDVDDDGAVFSQGGGDAAVGGDEGVAGRGGGGNKERGKRTGEGKEKARKKGNTRERIMRGVNYWKGTVTGGVDLQAHRRQ